MQEILRGDALRKLEVIEEAVIGLGAECNLRSGIEHLHSLGHHMSCRMTQDAQSFGRFRGDDLDLRAIMHGRVQIGKFSVDFAAKSRLRKAGADSRSYICDRRALGNFLLRAIR